MPIRFGDNLQATTAVGNISAGGSIFSKDGFPVLHSTTYATRTALIAANIPSSVTFVRTAGYTSVGDGGHALYERVGSQPSHAGKLQTADGGWWEIADNELEPRQFGVIYWSSTDQSTEAQNFISTCTALQRPGRIAGFIRANNLVATDRLILIGNDPFTSGFITTSTTGTMLCANTTAGPRIEKITFQGSLSATSGSLVALDATSSGFGMQSPIIQECRFVGGNTGVHVVAAFTASITDNQFNEQVLRSLVYENQKSPDLGRTYIERNRFGGSSSMPPYGFNSKSTTWGLLVKSGTHVWVRGNYFGNFNACMGFVPDTASGLFNLQISENSIQVANTGIFFNDTAAPLDLELANAPMANIDISSNNIQALFCIANIGLITNGQITSNMLFPTASGFGINCVLNGWTIVGNTFDGTLPPPVGVDNTTGIRLYGVEPLSGEPIDGRKQTYQTHINANMFSGITTPYAWGWEQPNSTITVAGTEWDRSASDGVETLFVGPSPWTYQPEAFAYTLYIKANSTTSVWIGDTFGANNVQIADAISSGTNLTVNLRAWDTLYVTYTGSAPTVRAIKHW
jgi:hypothetical protein